MEEVSDEKVAGVKCFMSRYYADKECNLNLGNNDEIYKLLAIHLYHLLSAKNPQDSQASVSNLTTVLDQTECTFIPFEEACRSYD